MADWESETQEGGLPKGTNPGCKKSLNPACLVPVPRAPVQTQVCLSGGRRDTGEKEGQNGRRKNL